MPSKNIFIQGYPGTGKTTLIKTLLPRLGAAGGFYTEEIREHGTRKGFRLITLQGEQGTLAHVASTSCFRVGKYGIQRETLEALGVASLRAAIDDGRKELVVIDEVAAMELSSPRFRVAVTRALDSPKPVLATLQMKPHPFTDKIKARSDVLVRVLTPQNRASLPEQVMAALMRVPR